jgi:L-threonylcarbamoyladenylate synthase
VREELGAQVALVLDGGDCAVGIESTIVDCSRDDAGPRILRPGGVRAADLAAVLGCAAADLVAPAAAPAPRVPGALASHYAPRTPLRLAAADELERAWNAGARIAVLARHAAPRAGSAGVWHRLPDDAEGYAQGLYAALRELDALELEAIWVEAPPAAPHWDAVRDRLRRAAA